LRCADFDRNGERACCVKLKEVKTLSFKYKQMILDVIRAGQEIEIYAGEFAADTFEAKERELNGLYNPPWVDRHG
jgi:hypothetical protein